MNEQERKIKSFSDDWQGKGYEKGEAQKFWRALLRNVLNVDEPDKIVDFEKPVKIDDQTKWIDCYIARTKVLIEQKSYGGDLSKAFEQAKTYSDNLPYSERPRWIIACNFNDFKIYDLVEMTSLEYLLGKTYEPLTFTLADLRYIYPRLKFIVDPNIVDVKPEVKISIDAAEIVDSIHKAFKRNYERARIVDYKDALAKLCTRLVFCFYASHAQILDDNQFFDYLQKFKDADSLLKLFDVMNTPPNQRHDLDDDLKAFPYVNGGLFDEKIFIPNFSNRFDGNPMLTVLTANNPDKFNWRKISPTIFGAMFESILHDDERRAEGIHYTSIENIHKVIDPLFLDDLHAEFLAAKNKHLKNRPAALLALQDKISKLTFLDPACGSGNFLTETYLSLRRLENEILEDLRRLKVTLPDNPVKVSINQFYGIEINSFAVAVAQTALWIAENQMLQATEGALGTNLQALPLTNYATIIKANALRVDWHSIAPHVDYIIGNPPYRGYSDQSRDQKADMRRVFPDNIKAGKLDYVCCWFRKAVEFIGGTKTRCAFVSTNSVVQGEQCAYLWKELYERHGVHLDFCHRTFKWLSDSDYMAHVHCVIVGFSTAPNPKPKLIFDGDKVTIVDNINFYLTDGEILFIESHANHIQDGVPKMMTGNRPADGGNLIIEADDLDDFLRREPAAQKFIRPLIGADEFIKGKRRYCLWLDGVSMSVIQSMPLVAERVEACRQERLNGAEDRRKLAATPHLFRETRNPQRCLVIPKVSGERRQYIPINFIDSNTIATDLLFIIPAAQIYHFGVLTSSIHMAWMRTVAGYLGTSYRYSAQVVYNNFVWAEVSSSQRRLIEESAQRILDVRARYGDWTFAALYNEETMPDDLKSAHKWNDYNVALAYGFDKFLDDEARIVAELMRLYKRAVDNSARL